LLLQTVWKSSICLLQPNWRMWSGTPFRPRGRIFVAHTWCRQLTDLNLREKERETIEQAGKQPPGVMTGLQNTEDLGSSNQVLQWHPLTVTSQNPGTPDINTKFVNMHNTPPNAFWNYLWCINPSNIHHDVGHPKVGMNIHVLSHSIALTCFRWVELTLKDPISTRPTSGLEIIHCT
jgi:hypothetical protein